MIKKMTLLALLLMSLSTSFQLMAENSSDIYPIQHRNPQQLAGKLNQLYGDTLKIVSDGQQILLYGEKTEVDSALTLLRQIDRATASYRLRFADKPETLNSKSYSTVAQSTIKGQSFTVDEDQTLRLSQQTEEQQSRSTGVFWLQVEDVQKEMEGLELTVRPVSDSEVKLSYQYRYRQGQQYQTFSNVRTITLDTWQSILGSKTTESHNISNSNNWSTDNNNQPNLYVYIERMM